MHTVRNKGFTLVELMIVLAIIAVIAAIAIPNIFEARKSANEAAAIGTLKTIQSCQSLFRESDKEGDGNIDYGTLAELSASGLLDNTLADGTKTGYLFQTGPATSSVDATMMKFWGYANPRVLDATGNRAYVINHEGVIYYTQQEIVAGPSLTALQQDALVPFGMYPVK